jgi:hypothetical protein
MREWDARRSPIRRKTMREGRRPLFVVCACMAAYPALPAAASALTPATADKATKLVAAAEEIRNGLGCS